MNFEQMYYITLGAVIDLVNAHMLYTEMARTADGEEERNRCNRRALMYKAKATVLADREMDRLVSFCQIIESY